MGNSVHLGFEVGTGAPVSVPFGHMVITGQTQLSGKITTLEALVSRSGRPAIAFVTKRGERSFRGGRRIPPYFRERADWKFVASILESVMQEKMRFERAWIVRACKGARSLADVQRNVRDLQAKSKRGMDADVYMLLGEYLDMVVPLIEALPASSTVDLAAGLNVMDLGGYPEQLQALVIQSVMAWVHQNAEDTITLVPEAWKFMPRARSGPVKLAAASIAREGAGIGNLLWIDSQDIAGTEYEILRQASVWLLGVQRETNEIKRSLAMIPAGIKKPKPDDVAGLMRGHFWACVPGGVRLVYVQPAWMDAETARRVATGDEPTIPPPPLSPAPEPITEETTMTPAQEKKLDKILDELVSARHANGVASPLVGAPALALDLPDDSAYLALKARLLKDLAKDAPAVLKVLALEPELEVTVERRSIEIDGDTLKGRLARLIADGWFDEPKTNGAAFKELERRGAKTSIPSVWKEVEALAALGFLTKEGAGYQAVKSMKVNVRHAR